MTEIYYKKADGSMVLIGNVPDSTQSPPPPSPPSPTTSTGLDDFGTKMIYPTVSGGRVFNAPFNTGSQRTLSSGQRDGTSDLKPLGSAQYTIVPSAGEMRINGSVPRVYVFDEARQKMFENVEVTCYYNSVGRGNMASYQGMEIGVRGQHELQKGNDTVRTYYCRHSIDKNWWRMKEDVHPTSKDVVMKSGVDFAVNKWYGMKFIVRNMANGDVKLESYQDLTDGAGGGTWTKMYEFVDTASNPWAGYPVYTSETPSCGCHSVFARSDNATDFRLKKFSIREVGPAS